MNTENHRKGTEALRDGGTKWKDVPMPGVPIPWGMVAAIGVLLLMTERALAQPCGGYEVTIIQQEDCVIGAPPTIGLGISEVGDVVGYYRCPGGEDQAFLWIGNEEEFITVPMPPGTILSWAYDIAGTQIVGAFDLGGDGLGNLGFLYEYETGEFTSLGTLPGGNWSEALAINANGVATGFWGNNNIGPWQVFLWKNGEMIDIGPQLNGPNNIANGISDTGDRIVGWMGIAPHVKSNAFVWDQGEVTVLPFIPGGFSSAGAAINSRGDVAGLGWMFDKDANEDVRRAFAWIDCEMIMLGTLPGYPDSFARGINDDRIVVGFAQTTGARAFVWQDGVLTDLNELVPPELGLDITVASAINSAGQIIAHGEDSKSDVVSFVLTPIDPPIGDLNGDCRVGASDLLILLASWGPCADCNDCPADLDGDCAVGVADLLILLGNWG